MSLMVTFCLWFITGIGIHSVAWTFCGDAACRKDWVGSWGWNGKGSWCIWDID